MIDEKIVVNVVMMVLSSLVAWLFKVIFDRSARNEQAIRDLAKTVEEKYQSKEVAREINQSIKDKLDTIMGITREINQKLDQKADK